MSQIEQAVDGGLVESADVLHELTKSPRPRLVYDVLGHPKGMPSVREFAYYNPSLKRNAIQYHLDELVDLGVFDKRKLPTGERRRDRPSTFYALSEAGRAFLAHHDLLGERAAWRAIHDEVEKTDEIVAIEEMARPE